MFWEKLFCYIENFLLFYVDKINMFVFILYNDDDGVVFWYQGIEFFVVLCCLGKLVWLFNYNDNLYWVMGRENWRDFMCWM